MRGRDSVTASDIPNDANAEWVGGYNGPGYVWTQADWDLFPNKPHVRIALATNVDGDELDVETGAVDPNDGAGIVTWVSGNPRPVVSIYVNHATLPRVRGYIDTAGLSGKVRYRVAEWSGSDHMTGEGGEWACQWAAPGFGSAGHWDENTATDLSWLDATITPQPPPPFPRILQLTNPHMIGDDVKALQLALNAHGAALAVDGDFGALTDQAVRVFQTTHGMTVDGQVGPETEAALQARPTAPAPQPTPPVVPTGTNRGAIVAAAQSQLGYLSGAGFDGPNKYSQDLGRPSEAWCFAAGTLITTPDGLVDIADLTIGDEVVSASGVTRRVQNITTHEADNVIVLKACGLDGTVTTTDHPYLARRLLGRNGSRRFDSPRMVPAGTLNEGDLIALPRPVTGGQTFDEKQAYVVGRWLADGWVTFKESRTTGQMFPLWCVCASHNEADMLGKSLAMAGIVGDRRTYPTCEHFSIPIGTITAVLAEAEAHAHDRRLRRLPGCVLRWDEAARRAVLDGYLDGHGTGSSSEGSFACAATASRSLAYGIAGLARSLGYVVSIEHYDRRSSVEWIEGRKVRIRGCFEVHIRHANTSNGDVISTEHADWVPVRSVTAAPGCPVFNLTVATEHTFIADCAAVHNCGDFVTWIFQQKGVPLPSMQPGLATGFAYCPDAVNYGRAHNLSRPSWQAEPADIFLFDWNGDGVSDHTEIMVGKNGASVITIGGNSGPSGGVNQHSWNCPDGIGNNAVLVTLNAAALVNLGGAPMPGPAPIPAPQPSPVPVHTGPPWPGRVLMLKSPHMQGQDVRTFQARMLQRGWNLGPTGADGDFGQLTANAVFAFQREKGLAADGLVGPQTWDAAFRDDNITP